MVPLHRIFLQHPVRCDILFSLFISTTLFAQDVRRQWNGLLKVSGSQLRVVFNIDKTLKDFSASIDTPDQEARSIPVEEANFEDGIKLVR